MIDLKNNSLDYFQFQISSRKCLLIKKLLNNPNLIFLFSAFSYNIENIDTKMFLHGF